MFEHGAWRRTGQQERERERERKRERKRERERERAVARSGLSHFLSSCRF